MNRSGVVGRRPHTPEGDSSPAADFELDEISNGVGQWKRPPGS
jgi:hypothetical protein